VIQPGQQGRVDPQRDGSAVRDEEWLPIGVHDQSPSFCEELLASRLASLA
jgi:hypothetical protein